MPSIELLDSPDDPRLSRYADLKSSRRSRALGDVFIVEGRLCVQRLLRSSIETVSVLVDADKADEVAGWVDGSCPVYALPSDRICELVGYDFHRGVLACGRRPNLRSVETLNLERRSLALAGALGVSEPENLGSMLRTAAALGVEKILIGPRTVDPFARRTVRVSMATVLGQELFELNDPVRQLSTLQAAGEIRTVVTTLASEATPLDRFIPDHRATILLMGSEANGVDREIEELATDRVTIPMQLGTDSLNVAVAAAIFMYELVSRH